MSLVAMQSHVLINFTLLKVFYQYCPPKQYILCLLNVLKAADNITVLAVKAAEQEES